MKKLTVCALLATIGSWVLLAFPAQAAPSNTRVGSVHQCVGTSCGSGSTVGNGDAVANTIEVEAESTDTFGLAWLRLDARRGTSGDWTCLQQWSLNGATSASRLFRWNTKLWPDPDAASYDCPPSLPSSVTHSTGARTLNGEYDMRVVAQSSVSGTQSSSIFVVKMNNAPTPPTWAGDPDWYRDGNGKPYVKLEWNASPEPDVVEYHFVRDGTGPAVEYWVNAASPGGQGCSKSSGIFTCYDDDFPAQGYGGDYSYSVYAFRSSPVSSATCASGGRCIASAASSNQTVQIDEPSPSPSPTDGGSGSPSPSKTPSGGGGSGGGGTGASPVPSGSSSPSRVLSRNSSVDNSEFFEGTYDNNLPYEDQQDFNFLPGDDVGSETDQGTGLEDDTLASGDRSTGLAAIFLDRRIAISLAAGLLMVMLAGHMVRLLYDR